LNKREKKENIGSIIEIGRGEKKGRRGRECD